MELPAKFVTKHPKLAEFIQVKAPHLLETAAKLLPDKGGLGILKNLISNDPKIKDEDKLEFFKLALDADAAENKEVTERHKNDMASDSALSKNVRPLALAVLLLAFLTLVVLEAALANFKVDPENKAIIRTLLLAVFGFYFGGRTIEKVMSLWKAK